MSYKNNYVPNNVILNSNVLPQTRANLSTFNLSEALTTTIGFDKLYPVYWEELNPNDHLEVTVKSLGRLMPMVAPTMSNLKMKYFAFFIPNRLLWKHWVNFMGEKTYQDSRTEYVVPQISMKSEYNVSGGIADYLGVPPTGTTVDHTVSALPFRAYNKIWNEWFRANELQAPVTEYSDDTDDIGKLGIDYKLLKKGKPLDYFTSCLPYPQSGEQVTIPLLGNAKVIADPNQPTFINTTSTVDGTTGIKKTRFYRSGQSTTGWTDVRDVDAVNTNLYVDMSAVTGISIEALRKASALQVLLERDAKAGETYVDLMNMHYATTVPDFLVGRSQFLGSATSALNVEPIAQTSGTDATPQGNLSAVATTADDEKLCEISAVEHGIFMILACADGEVSYQQGVPRKFSKNARFDYMFPEFWNLGDQAILNKEIFLSTDPVLNEKTFGYQERYREYREGISKVSGLMRSGVEGSLDVWHLAQKFNNTPTLNTEFIECNTPIDRVMAVPNEDQILLNLYFDIKATRNLPVTSNPSILAGRV